MTEIPFKCDLCGHSWQVPQARLERVDQSGRRGPQPVNVREYRSYCPVCGRVIITAVQISEADDA